MAALAGIGTFDADGGPQRTVVERVGAPVVATVPVLSVDAGEVARADTSLLVTVESTSESTGTGIVLRSDGHVLTAASLVGDGERVLVATDDGERGGATVVGTDPATGVAVLEAGWLAGRAGAVFGSPSALAIGDQVTAAAPDSATAGVISDLSATGMIAGEAAHGLVRTTTVLPEDGVGGPVLDAQGRVVAVAVGADPSPATWAIPVDLARRVARDLIAEGVAHHSWLGVEGEDTAKGPMLGAVAEGSPAEQAGLAAGDILVTIDSRPVQSMADVILVLRDRRPGDHVTIDYRRNDATQSCMAVLGEREG